MWTSGPFHLYRSLFLLVRIRSGKFRLILPLALFLIDETFDIFADGLWIAEKFIPKRYCRHLYLGPEDNGRRNQTMEWYPSLYPILALCRELLNEFRRHGRYSLVEAEVGQGSYRKYVSVEFF